LVFDQLEVLGLYLFILFYTLRYTNDQCLLIDFAKAFDVVRHSILLTKLSALDIPPILNCIIAFLSDCSQISKTRGSYPPRTCKTAAWSKNANVFYPGNSTFGELKVLRQTQTCALALYNLIVHSSAAA